MNGAIRGSGLIYLTHYKPRSAFRMYLNNNYVQSGWSDLGFRLSEWCISWGWSEPEGCDSLGAL